ncbi:MAG: ribosome maturation factor RimM [Eubacteriales bacterium]
MKANLISVGEIINTHGIKGELKVRPLTDFPERFETSSVLLMEKDGQTKQLTVERARPQKNMLIIKFKEIPDMDSAEELKGGMLKITRDQLPELPEDTYYIFEIIGLEVRTEDGRILGRVRDITQTGSNDVYIVAGQTKEYLIPGLKEVVKSLDKEKGVMVIKPLDGLLEI